MILLLTYKIHKFINESFSIAALPNYGVDINGSFQVTFNSTSDQLFFGLCSEAEFSKLWNPTIEYSKACSLKETSFSDINKTVFTNQSSQIEILNIPFGIYTPIIIACDSPNLSITIDVSFRGKYYLDSREKLLLFPYLVNFGLYFVILISLIVIFFIRHAFFIKYYYFTIITFLLGFFSSIYLLIELAWRFENVDNRFLYYNTYILQVVFEASLMLSIVIGSSGWGVHNDFFPHFSFIFSFISITIFISSEILPLFLSVKRYSLLCFLLELFSLFTIAKTACSEMRVVELYLLAYNEVLVKLGIDSTKTLVHRRYIQQYIFLITMVFFFIYRILLLVFPIFLTLPLWLYNGSRVLFNLLATGIILFVFLPYKILKEDFYATYRGGDNGISYEFVDLDDDVLPIHSETQMQEWKEGDPLPPPPLLTRLDYVVIEDDDDKSHSLLPQIG